ncbi:hypothetical protein [Desulfitobacterium chlororespirans]|uniref:Uncharacterized protein n=1 Tax=Desulfitobacterium chlororespirans DSM 11544 TaxID=1121395 RepID=A0A1M7SZJ8_9FIRM|nr:hypothetical protein [Desulfitobacterium chlororespirans]SHN63861.1 hypothetical protein SAMN02745215_01348 [Desulfitobacterium chlororespirans DSM 11544]
MFKFKIATTLVLGMCLTLAASGSVQANEDRAVEQAPDTRPALTSMTVEPNDPVVSPAEPGQGVDPALQELNKVIYQFVFEEHRGEFGDKGFAVTHTGLMSDHVEIGIQPYSEEHAQYLYGLFGKEKVKVVEGEFASPLAAAAGGAEPAVDPLAVSGAEAGNAAQAKDASAARDGAQEEGSDAILYGLGAVVVLGAGAFGVKRTLSRSKK